MTRFESEIEEVDSFRQSHTLSTIVSDLPSHLVRELSEAFKVFDLDGDGKISKTELGTVLHSLGEKLTDAELERMIKDVDADGDGQIDLQEFIDLNTDSIDINRVTEGGCSSSVQDALESAFNVFDADKNGLISAEELHRVLSSLGDKTVSLEDCQCMISCVDIDGDDMVNFREFQSLMTGTLAGGSGYES